MIELILKGGPIMWPLLIASVISLAVIFERLIFFVRQRRNRRQQHVSAMLEAIRAGNLESAAAIGSESPDPVAATLSHALRHKDVSFAEAYQNEAQAQLHKLSGGLSVLDTIITLAPLLGLLGTVTGMIGSFGILGANELGAPSAITGGIAEALIATAFGLGVAITSLIPFNLLNRHVEKTQHELQHVGTLAELALRRHESAASVFK